MLALIIGGGSGSRLNMGEKPLVKVCGRPMIERVIEAFSKAGCEPVAVLTSRVPYTVNWCRAHGVPHVIARGEGYVEDMVEAIGFLEERAPFFTSVVDLPCLTPAILNHIRDRYFEMGRDALSTWVPCSMIHHHGCIPRHVELVDGIPAGAAGVNILRGDLIASEQEEYRLLVQDPALVFNVNTRRELMNAERYLAGLSRT